MKTSTIPNTDSITELASFWDENDLTDFEDQLEEVTDPVFERKSVVKIPFASKEISAVQEIANSQGIGLAELIRGWVLEKLYP